MSAALLTFRLPDAFAFDQLEWNLYTGRRNAPWCSAWMTAFCIRIVYSETPENFLRHFQMTDRSGMNRFAQPGCQSLRIGSMFPPMQIVIDQNDSFFLRGAIYCCRAVLAGMMKRKRGVIINFGSVTGEEGEPGPCLDYSAEKSAMHGMTKSLAILGAPHNVRACCVIPGPVLTRPQMSRMKTLLGRAAEPIELVDFILYLCSDKAAFITGSAHVIDGGHLLV